MGYSVYWHVPQRVYVIQLWGDISLEELKELSDKASEFARNGGAPVHLIGDARNVKSIPKNLAQAQKMAQVFREPTLGWVFFLNNDRIINFFASIISQLAGISYKSFQEPEEMMEMLQRIDSTLPELPPYTGEQVGLSE